jgi:hypothetical protein
MKENIGYKILPPRENDDVAQIMIAQGDYDGVTFKFGKLRVEEDKEADVAHMSFEYRFISNDSAYTTEELDGNPEFEAVVSQILENILMEEIPEQTE